MREVVVVNHVTLDGVMQAPAAPDEDTRGDFPYGGWEPPYGDEVMGKAMGAGIGEEGALLLGRRTYEHFAGYWPHAPADNPFTDVMHRFRKYVASTTLRAPLEWHNAVLLEGDATTAVARLKEEAGPSLTVLGSGVLTRSLLGAGLVDRLTLLVHPLVLGTGLRLFADGSPHTTLELVDTTVTTTGVIITTYRPGPPPAVS